MNKITASETCFRIKQIPEDFIVDERMSMNYQSDGVYSIYLMRKRNMTTHDAISGLAKANRIRETDFGVAGNKDSRAITRQFVSVKGRKKLRPSGRVELKLMGYVNAPITLGANEGNNFKILLRDMSKGDQEKAAKALDGMESFWFPNYFGKQRFVGNNAEIGLRLLKKDFEKAAEILGLDSKDAIRELRKKPLRVLKMYVHAYQSKLFNIELGELINGSDWADCGCIVHIGEEGDGTDYWAYPNFFLKQEKGLDIKNHVIELPGFGSDAQELANGLRPRDFIIRQIPGLSEEGTTRAAFAEMKDLKLVLKNDELNKGRYAIELGFELGKGCYATIAIDAIMACSKIWG